MQMLDETRVPLMAALTGLLWLVGMSSLLVGAYIGESGPQNVGLGVIAAGATLSVRCMFREMLRHADERERRAFKLGVESVVACDHEDHGDGNVRRLR